MPDNRVSSEEMRSLEQEANERYKASSTSSIGIPPTGPGGLFNSYGVDPRVMTTYVPPKGLESFLEKAGHVQKSIYDIPGFEIITGQTASTGNEAVNSCGDDAPVAGDLKVCNQYYAFGQLIMNSKSVDVKQIGKFSNRSQPMDFKLMNNPFAMQDPVKSVPLSTEQMFMSAVAKAAVEMMNSFSTRYAHLIFTGNPVNTSSNTGYKEFKGLDLLINTGYTDLETGLACPAADSLVMDANYSVVQDNAGTYVRNIIEMYRSRQMLAADIGMGNIEWAFVMRRSLFLALTDVWPCAYYTFRCYTAAPGGSNATAFVDTRDQVALRDDMRRGMYLLIDGQPVRVIEDNTIAEQDYKNGYFDSNLYLVPLSESTVGQLLYMDYFDFANQWGVAGGFSGFSGMFGDGRRFSISGDGRYFFTQLPNAGTCQQIQVATSKRVILMAPFLAARLDNCKYIVYVHERDYNHDSSFFVNGGSTSFPGTFPA
jgi:hypothetical protein